jgi:hypothetical protein
MIDVSKCRTCQAPVLFVPSATTGKLMILDAAAVPDGNTVIHEGKAYVVTGDIFDRVPDGLRFKSHWATCPDAKKWRKATDEKKGKS